MIKVKSVFIFLVVAIILFGCAKCPQKNFAPTSTTKTFANRSIIKTYSNQRFENLLISGNINASISKGKLSSITLEGDPENLKQSIAKDARGTIYIKNIPDSNSTIKAKIVTPMLISLNLENGANVKATNLCVSYLSLIARCNYNVNLKGKIFARYTQIDQHGIGKIAISWLDSDRITINADNYGIIWIAGVAHKLNARLADSAYLDSKYLRSDIISIAAKNSAQAFVTPLEKLQAFTKNNSSVYYYKRPQLRDINSKNSSNVLFLK